MSVGEYKIVLGDPDSVVCKVVVRENLNAALHWLGNEWPAAASDMEASVYVALPTGGFLRILGISREGVVNLSDVRIGVGMLEDQLIASTSPK